MESSTEETIAELKKQIAQFKAASVKPPIWADAPFDEEPAEAYERQLNAEIGVINDKINDITQEILSLSLERDSLKEKGNSLQRKRNIINGTQTFADISALAVKEPRQQQQEPARHQQHSDSDANVPLFKTNICKYFMDGNCTKGEACTFAHGADDLQNMSSNDNNKKTKICFHWTNGNCHKGRNCTFAHGQDELRGTKKSNGRQYD